MASRPKKHDIRAAIAKKINIANQRFSTGEKETLLDLTRGNIPSPTSVVRTGKGFDRSDTYRYTETTERRVFADDDGSIKARVTTETAYDDGTRNVSTSTYDTGRGILGVIRGGNINAESIEEREYYSRRRNHNR